MSMFHFLSLCLLELEYYICLKVIGSEILATRLDDSWTRHSQFSNFNYYDGGTCRNFQKCLLYSTYKIAESIEGKRSMIEIQLVLSAYVFM